MLCLDDILITTELLSEHFRILNKVFSLSVDYELKFRLDKCTFLYYIIIITIIII